MSSGIKEQALAVIVMGVSGCGKTSIGQALAARLGCSFLEGDALHSPANVDKMARGIPLDDADRWPWLDRVGDELARAVDKGGVAVATCSALRRAYRDRLRGATRCPTAFIHLTAPPDVLMRRMGARTGHFMPASLLDSQLALLEPPQADELARTFDVTQPQDAVAREAKAWLATLM